MAGLGRGKRVTKRGEDLHFMCAAKGGNVDCVRLLLQTSAPMCTRRTTSGSTPTHHAAERGDQEMLLTFLDAGCEVDSRRLFAGTHH